MDDYDPDVILDGNYITIKKVNKSHSGRYQCLAEDGSNEPAHERITVVVNCKLIARSRSSGAAWLSEPSVLHKHIDISD